jgi:hypothetical protein
MKERDESIQRGSEENHSQCSAAALFMTHKIANLFKDEINNRCYLLGTLLPFQKHYERINGMCQYQTKKEM